MDVLARRFQDAFERSAHRDRLVALIGQTELRLRNARERQPALKRTLDSERADVEGLEGLSLTAIFYTLLSKKTERLEEERRELVVAKLAHDECVHAVEAASKLLARQRGELAALGDVDGELAAALAERERALLREGGDAMRELLALSEAIAKTRTGLREMRKAAACGGSAIEVLEELTAELDQARRTGTWDMLSGGLVATSIKHSHLDRARDLAHEAQVDLLDLQDELVNVDLDSNVEVSIDGFDRFADYLLDGLVCDWLVQRKIHRSLDAARGMIRRVDRILLKLTGAMTRLRARLDEMEQRRRALLAG